MDQPDESNFLDSIVLEKAREESGNVGHQLNSDSDLVWFIF